MAYYDSLRNLILSSPSKICDTSTVYTYLAEELYTNIKLQALVSVSVFLIALIIFVVCHKADVYGRYFIYFLGLQIFFVALMFKISKSGFGSELSNLDQKIYNALKGMDESKTSAFSSIILFLLAKMHSNGNLSKCEVYKVGKNTSIDPSNPVFSYLTVPSRGEDNGANFQQTKKSKLFLDASGAPYLKPGLLACGNRISDTGFEGAKSSKDILMPLKDRNGGELKQFKDEKVTVLQLADIKGKKDALLASVPVKNEDANEVVVKEEVSVPEKGKSPDDSLSAVAENNIAKAAISKTVEEDNDSNDDTYFNNVLRTLNSEFTSNNKLSGSFKEIATTIDRTDGEIIELDASLKKLVSMGNSIEKELKSFNVSLKSLENARSQLIAVLRKIVPIKFIIDNLNYKESSDKQLNQIFKAGHEISNHESTHKQGDDNTIITVVQVFLILQAIVCIIFFIQVLTGGSTYALRMISVVLLGGNIILGIAVMALAQFYDKDCVLGRIPNCDPMFSRSFTQFARSANLDLKSSEMSKIEALSKSLDKIGTRTNNITTFLRDMFEDNLIGEYRIYNVQLRNILDKINFVKDDFKELTHGKINKNEFFTLINDAELRLSQISQNLSLVNPKFLFEFYTKEVIFGTYIKTERDRIIANSERQMGDRILKNRWRNKNECERKWREVCNKREKLDQLFLLMVPGSLVFLVGFTML